MLREVLPDVETKPCLPPLEGEAKFILRAANRSPEAHLDIRATGFWSRQQDAFLMLVATHPRSSFLSRQEIVGHLRSQECQKKHAYCQRINDAERAAFTPSVFSTFRMAGPETQIFLKSLAAMVCEKNVGLNRLPTSNKESSNRVCVALARSARCLYMEELNPNNL